MATIINKVDTITSCFTGQGDIVLFAAITDANYATADLASLVTGVTLGDIYNGSTSWTGDDATLESIKNEQGNIVCSRGVAGTYAFEFTSVSMSIERAKLFLGATDITNPATLPTWMAASPVPDMVGFGTTLPIVTRPIALFNQDKTKMLVFPKAKIVSSVTMDGTNVMIKSSVQAEIIDTTNLKTVMLIDAAPVYATA